MASKEQEQGPQQHEREGKQENEPLLYYRAPKFPSERPAGKACFEAQKSTFETPECNLAVHRFPINRTWCVAPLGDYESMNTGASEKTDALINEEMDSLLNRYLSKFRPVAVEDYDWRDIRPYTVTKDFFECLTFVTLVESNPKEPAKKLLAAADQGNAPWLRRFVNECWLPQERMHSAPYREYLVRSGAKPQELVDAEIQTVREREFVLGTGYTPLQATTYGWLQELITWRFYEAMRRHIMKGTAPENHEHDKVLAKILGDIGKQENFHRYVYFTGAKTILKYDPGRSKEVIATASEFILPGHYMVPERQHEASHWATKFSFPLRPMLHDIAHGLVELVGYRGLGETIISYEAKNQLQWYAKMPITLVKPFTKVAESPINYSIGKVASKLF